MNKTLSDIKRLNWFDLLKTVILTVLAIVINWLLKNVADIQFSADPSVNQGVVGTISFVLSYLLKQLATDDKGSILGIGAK